MRKWLTTVNVRQPWKATPFELMRDGVVSAVRRSSWNSNELDELLEELSETEDTADFDIVWDAIYDLADQDSVWIATR